MAFSETIFPPTAIPPTPTGPATQATATMTPAEFETARLDALYRSGLLDTPPEEEFDDLVKLASYICQTPIANFTLVDRDRQWFKAKLGLDATETPVEHSFCAHAIAAPGIMVVPDATHDTRFADNPFVTGDPNVRFYAGAPVETDDGFRIGTLCVIDRVPREITQEQRDLLEMLGKLASKQLLLRDVLRDQEATLERARAAEAEMRSTHYRFTVFMDNSPAAAFLKDGEGRYVYANQTMRERFKCLTTEWIGKRDQDIWPAGIIQIIHAVDARVLAGSEQIQSEQAIEIQGETQNWLTYRFPITDEDGQCFIAGMSIDITARIDAELQAEKARTALAARVDELQERARQLVLIGEMGEMLQSCREFDEAYRVIARCLKRLFPASGALYKMSASQTLVEAVIQWGPEESSKIFTPDECWGIRRGRLHVVSDAREELLCRHNSEAGAFSYVCAPLVAQREASGLLYLRATVNFWTDDNQQLVRAVSEQIALALANLKLQEKLREQSIRDALTGLYNRRYLEESLEREIHRAGRSGHQMSVLMFDVDHFKKFNDTFGHEAGDLLLRQMGECITSFVRKSDIACRYGGEEFALLMPELSVEQAQLRAEALRKSVEAMEVQYRRQPLGKVTISVGVATYPLHGSEGTELMNAADAALYKAKHEGRNRVVCAG
jgi:diguanylate cyclase (GGDEF)-like protein/PAS domain S-box-containing protein